MILEQEIKVVNIKVLYKVRYNLYLEITSTATIHKILFERDDAFDSKIKQKWLTNINYN